MTLKLSGCVKAGPNNGCETLADSDDSWLKWVLISMGVWTWLTIIHIIHDLTVCFGP